MAVSRLRRTALYKRSYEPTLLLLFSSSTPSVHNRTFWFPPGLCTFTGRSSAYSAFSNSILSITIVSRRILQVPFLLNPSFSNKVPHSAYSLHSRTVCLQLHSPVLSPASFFRSSSSSPPALPRYRHGIQNTTRTTRESIILTSNSPTGHPISRIGLSKTTPATLPTTTYGMQTNLTCSTWPPHFAEIQRGLT